METSNPLSSDLLALGLGTEEIRVYLALLELSSGFVSVIAKRAKVARVNCYHLLDGLVRKGLATLSVQNGKKVYQPRSPENLVKQQAERLRIAERALPALKQISRGRQKQVAIRTIEGAAGIRSLFEESLSTADEILGYTRVESIERLLGDYLHYFAEQRLQRKIRARFLSPFTKRSKQFVADYYPTPEHRRLTEFVFVESGEFPFDSELYIFGNSVATFSPDPKELLGVIIESPRFAATYRSMFQLSWLGATTFVIGG